MKNIICSFFLIALSIIPYSCKKKGTDPDPIKPPVDTIPKVDTNYLHFLKDTLVPIQQNMSDSNYLLKNKSLDTIRKYINGKWQLRFVYIGNTSDRFYPDHSFVEFLFNTTSNVDSIKFYSDINIDYTIKQLIWKRRSIPNIDSSYMFNYQANGVSFDKVINSLKNDTLITIDDASSGFLNLYTKVH